MTEKPGTSPHSPWLTFLAASVVIASAFVLLLEPDGYRRNITISAQEAGLAAENQRIARQNRQLQEDISALKSDPETIEQLARQELGMVRPGERVIQPLPAPPPAP